MKISINQDFSEFDEAPSKIIKLQKSKCSEEVRRFRTKSKCVATKGVKGLRRVKTSTTSKTYKI